MEPFHSTFGRNNTAAVAAFLLFMGIAAGTVGPDAAWAQEEVTLTVTFVGGGSSVDFGRLRNLAEDGRPLHESSTRQVRLAIQPAGGNTRPYLVTQTLASELTQETGGTASPQVILFRVEQESGSGEIRVPDQTPLSVGEEEIYRSSPSGGNAELLITYDLTASPDQEAGSYNGFLDYRVSLI